MSQNISEKILSLLNTKIFCLGDLMLDKYIIDELTTTSKEINKAIISRRTKIYSKNILDVKINFDEFQEIEK